MSVIPASRLSASDIARLGNNVSDPVFGRRHRRQRRQRRVVAAVNRSLASFGETVDVLHRRCLLPVSSRKTLSV